MAFSSGLNVVSLFDGMSCGRIALDRCAIKVKQYFASEIEKAPIEVSKTNWDDITHVGDVTKWHEWQNPNFPKIDLLIGGSPCQDFSFAGKRKGATTSTKIQVTSLEQYLTLKSEGMAFEGQSYLFWEYVQILRHLQKQNPNIYFLLENVKMSVKWQNVISQALNVAPVLINSALVCAQNRNRLYWTNIRFNRNIKDRGVALTDILDLEVEADSAMSKGWHKWWLKNGEFQQKKRYSQLAENSDKAICMTARQYVSYNGNFVKIYQVPRGKNKGGIVNTKGKCPTITGNSFEQNCLLVTGKTFKDYNIRRFTVNECEKLQTVSVGYCKAVSKSQAYKMLGNGWTVDVIAIILNGIIKPCLNKYLQPQKPVIPINMFDEVTV